MTQIATVERIINAQYAEISVPRKSACGHDCEECAGCGVSGAAVHAKAANPIDARPGQKVVVQSDTRKMLGIVSLVYLTPVVLFLLGYLVTAFLTDSVAMQYSVAGVGFAVGISTAAVFYDRKLRARAACPLPSYDCSDMFGYVHPAPGDLPRERRTGFRHSVLQIVSISWGGGKWTAERFILNYDFTYLADPPSDGTEGDRGEKPVPCEPHKKTPVPVWVKRGWSWQRTERDPSLLAAAGWCGRPRLATWCQV